LIDDKEATHALDLPRRHHSVRRRDDRLRAAELEIVTMTFSALMPASRSHCWLPSPTSWARRRAAACWRCCVDPTKVETKRCGLALNWVSFYLRPEEDDDERNSARAGSCGPRLAGRRFHGAFTWGVLIG
jgi:hypothetical protein